MSRRGWPLLGAVLALLATTPGAAGAAPGDLAGADGAVERVLVISVPGVTWAEVDAASVPNLARLAAESAVGNLSTRPSPTRRTTHLGDGYITLGAGTRAVGDNLTDGQGLGVDEPFGSARAGAVFERRTGRSVDQGIVQLAVATIADRNEPLLLDAEPGALGAALADAGHGRAVIANGDGAEPGDVDPTYRRQAVSALMDLDGVVPAGVVGDQLLIEDAEAPFGLRYDHDAVVDAFQGVWNASSVVLVEASDLARTDAYRSLTTPEQGADLWAQALRSTDDLVGAVLAEVDPERDAVLLIAPAHPEAELGLTVAALRSPGVEPGLLRSATTRRSGFVQLYDVAPTVLDLLGVDRPSSMDGRPFEVGRRGGDHDDRRAFLVDADDAAKFIADRVDSVAAVFVVVDAALLAGMVLWARGVIRVGGRIDTADVARFTALAVLGLVPAIYLARLVAFHDVGVVAYWSFLALVAIALAAGYEVVGRRHPLDRLILATATIVGVLVVDVVMGAPLQISSALGNSPIVAGRFAGYGNLAYPALSTAALTLAVLLAARIGRPTGPPVAIGVLALAIVAAGAPFWGSNVGAFLSMAPAYLLTALLLLGWRIRLRTACIAVTAALGAFFVFGLADLARPPQRRTHLGRLFERVADDGWSSFATVVERKLNANFRNVSGTVWILVIPITVVLLIVLTRWTRPQLRELRDRIPDLNAGALGAAVLVVVGFAVNDSGVRVPGVMLTVLNAALIMLVVGNTEAPDRPGAAEANAPPNAGVEA